MRTDTCRRILDAALELFAENGFHTTTIDKISAKAGISKGLVYNHFESKDALLFAVFDAGFEEMEKVIPELDLSRSSEKPVEVYIELLFQALTHNIRFWKLYFTMSVQPDIFSKIRDRMDTMFELFINRLRDHFRRLYSPVPELDAILLGAVMDGLTFQYILRGDKMPLDDLKKRLIAMFCRNS